MGKRHRAGPCLGLLQPTRGDDMVPGPRLWGGSEQGVPTCPAAAILPAHICAVRQGTRSTLEVPQGGGQVRGVRPRDPAAQCPPGGGEAVALNAS